MGQERRTERGSREMIEFDIGEKMIVIGDRMKGAVHCSGHSR